jgi:hypothetical protein
MSRLSGFIDPETRCYVEAVSAAVRPGRRLPDGTTLVETPDDRSGAQRHRRPARTRRVDVERRSIVL